MKTLFPSTKSFLQRIFCPVMAVILATVVSQPLFAQNRNAGEIRGTLLDQSGAAMPGATVTLTNIQTGITSTLSVGNDGLYDAPSVEPGTYNVTFFKEGFKKLVRSGIVLHVETITLDAQL